VLVVGLTDKVSGDADRPLWVTTRVVSDEQVAEVPEYHFAVKVGIPPFHEAERVTDWPESILGAAGVIEPAVSAV